MVLRKGDRPSVLDRPRLHSLCCFCGLFQDYMVWAPPPEEAKEEDPDGGIL